ncbi:ArsR/SmtB family transcription factor [Sphingobium limneticum]|uniref:Winged helix-turn-helix transcriptional regulator n=1 Tax=Sphingobium limneticum TaxID=1007511 RepID=A0A5J5I7J9_9SPHN|nr:metalloregulator ArsR/SmtB family transcription factor [Sphingobium limneticum]KAA9019612.1 winged helix-turn-helix transcriptional regulator [Sphingobium limneticum]KAA9032070.1 winged helix-turn-helix transcriptional regulator [Sphingobium limneticum]
MQLKNLPIFAALGQPTRWRTFELLLHVGEKGMLQGEIARSLDVDKNLMSTHLKVLRDAGLVASEKNGREVTYRVTPDVARKTAAALLKAIDGPGEKA